MVNVLTRKLEAFGTLLDADRLFLDRVVANKQRVEAHVDLIKEEEAPSDVLLVMSGFACRYKLLDDGRRQIVAYLVPGDFCDLNVFVLKSMDHSIATLCSAEIARIPRATILEMLDRPSLSRALLMATLVDEAILREWLVNLGQRSAEHRIAHLFCELYLRLTTVGLASDGHFELPITQVELGDTVGLSAVHVNRSLQNLRNQGLITVNRSRVTIRDVIQLQQISGFRANYLHIQPVAQV